MNGFPSLLDQAQRAIWERFKRARKDFEFDMDPIDVLVATHVMEALIAKRNVERALRTPKEALK